LAHAFLNEGAELVFGGGKTGLMGHLATSIIEGGGTAHGVMPHFLKDIEMNHPMVSDFIFVDTMSERKQLLLANTEGLIALPGGCGTLEELLEAITLKRLGQYLKPIVIVNQEGFYTPQLEMLEKMMMRKTSCGRSIGTCGPLSGTPLRPWTRFMPPQIGMQMPFKWPSTSRLNHFFLYPLWEVGPIPLLLPLLI